MNDRPNTDQTTRLIQAFRDTLQSLPMDDSFPDEGRGRMVCAEAINALAEGNYGVGCLIVDPDGLVVARGHNEVFWPYFRSEGHAEMVVLDRFEADHPEVYDMSRFMLHVSLEPCPMCLGRLIISGIGGVKFLAADVGGGMIQHLDAMPVNFRRLAEAQKFGPANCSPALRTLAHDVFLSNLGDMQAALRKRRSIL